jgi:cysteine-rich repeat protein
MSQDSTKNGARENIPTLVTGPTSLVEGGDPGSLVGGVLLNYKIIERLAEGGMGIVYRAEHTSIGKPAAVKVIKAEYCQNEVTMRRFYQEGRIVNQIRHPNIIDIFDFGELPDKRAFYIMEFLEGEALSKRVSRGMIPPKEALPLMKQAAEALRAAHQAGIIHRDLKPENFFITNDEGTPKLKLLDFGIAKLVGMEEIQDKLTKTGNIIGTPHYMSPEQINGANIDARSDIYSLGMVFYEMLSGMVPFGQRPVGQILAAQILGDTGEISQNLQILTIQDGFKSLVRKAIATRPQDRYPDMDALLSDLNALAEGKEIKAPPPKLDTRLSAAPPKKSKVWLGMALALALGGGIGAWQLWPKAPENPATQATTQEESISVDALRAASIDLLKQSLTAPGPSLKAAAVKALGDLGDTESRARIEALLVATEDIDVRANAALALADIGEKSAVDALQAQRSSATSYVKVSFDAALFSLGAESADTLLPALKGSPEELVIAAKALASFAKTEFARESLVNVDLSALKPLEQFFLLAERTRLGDKDSQSALQKKLDSQEPAEQILAAYSLARIGSDLGKEKLSGGLTAAQPELALLAANGLLYLGDPSGASLLQNNLSAKSPTLRKNAAEGLALTQDETAALQMAPLLQDKDPQVQISAAAAILSIVGLGESWLSTQSVAWDEQAKGSADPKVRARYFARLGKLPSEEALAILQKAYPDPDKEVNRAIINAVARIASEQQSEAARTFLEGVTKEKDSANRIAGLIALAKTSPEAKAELDELLASPKAGEEGLVAVQSAAEQDNVEVLLEALRNKAFAVQFEAALALARRGNDAGIEALKVGSQSKDIRVQNLAKIGLAQLGQNTDSLPDLEKLLGSDNEQERLAAVDAALLIPASEQKAFFRRAAKNSSPAVRIKAIEAAAKIGDLGPAKLALKDKDPSVKSAAASLLQVKSPSPAKSQPESKAAPVGCGNGVIEEGEKCDDNNKKDGDGCDSNCTVTACGNGIVTKGEECDSTNRDQCTAACVSPIAPPAKIDAANKLMLAGKSALTLGQYAKARGLFKKADSTVKQYDIQWWFAECDRLLAPTLPEPKRTSTLKQALSEYQKFVKANPSHKEAGKARTHIAYIKETLEE